MRVLTSDRLVVHPGIFSQPIIGIGSNETRTTRHKICKTCIFIIPMKTFKFRNNNALLSWKPRRETVVFLMKIVLFTTVSEKRTSARIGVHLYDEVRIVLTNISRKVHNFVQWSFLKSTATENWMVIQWWANCVSSAVFVVFCISAGFYWEFVFSVQILSVVLFYNCEV